MKTLKETLIETKLLENQIAIEKAKEYAVTQKTFWLVWNKNESGFPSFQHTTEKSAVTDAHRLSSKQPGDQFVVLKAVGYFRAGPPVPSWTKLK